MTVKPVQSAVTGNPFLPGLSAETSSPEQPSFEQQLSAAVKESLQKLGLKPDQVSVATDNSGGGASGPGLRQIVLNYRLDSSGGTSTGPEAASAPALPPYQGPRDPLDELPQGAGTLTASGSPLIIENAKPAGNQYGYAGVAARNPYFTTPSNPLRPGLVLGFQNWFQDNFILGGSMGPVPTNRTFEATGEGAQEALRLVREYAPDAKITSARWGSGGGPYAASNATLSIELPDGRQLNAGSILNSYYNQGFGVSVSSDDVLRRAVEA